MINEKELSDFIYSLCESLDEGNEKVADSIYRAANAICPNINGSEDANGGFVASLTESIMGLSSGAKAIADSISDLAEAVRESNETRENGS